MDVLINNAGVGIGASIAGKYGQPWLSMYAATKFAVVGLSQSAHKELAGDGVRFLLATSPACIVPEIQFIRPADQM